MLFNTYLVFLFAMLRECIGCPTALQIRSGSAYFCAKPLCLLLKSEMIFSVNEDILIVLKHYEILLAESCSTFAHIRAGTHIHDNPGY